MFICRPHTYHFKGLTIETPAWCGPWPVRKNGEPYQRLPRRVREIMDEFCALSDPSPYRVGGGCVEV